MKQYSVDDMAIPLTQTTTEALSQRDQYKQRPGKKIYLFNNYPNDLDGNQQGKAMYLDMVNFLILSY